MAAAAVVEIVTPAAMSTPRTALPTTATKAAAVKSKLSMAANTSNGVTTPAPNPPTALSAMRSAPLYLTSVERRGQPTAVREPIRRSNRPHDLQEAPIYLPTEDEWRDPIEYIRKITPEAKQYGICKIVPPDSWNPDFAIDTERFHFRTRKQDLNAVEGNSRANITYVDALLKFHKQNGNHLNRMPYVDKRPLDLYRLKKAVESRGGFDKVCRGKKWAEIGRDLGYSGKIMSSLSTSLKNSYQRWLCPYEEYLAKTKPGVQQQIEWENGGPITPSPAPSPAKKAGEDVNGAAAEAAAKQATEALQAKMNGQTEDGAEKITIANVPLAQPRPATPGFKPVNSGGFTAANSGFTPANRSSLPDGKTASPPKQTASPAPIKETTEPRPLSVPPFNVLKRQLSTESFSSVSQSVAETEDEANGRRSKRSKTGSVPTVAGSHMSTLRPTAPRPPRKENSSSIAKGEACEHCGKAEEAGFLAVCESCDNAYHGACLDPPIDTKPSDEWHCPRCLVGDAQFGFEEGGLYSLKQFQEKANDFKQAYFEKRMPSDAKLGGRRPVTEDDVEREFWRLVADIDEEVQVEYGADIHCTTHGSGFPTVEKHPNDPYSTDPWNLNILPLHPESLFRHIKSDISGMTVPWAYVGMTFSTFCWHNEDHYAYSANYQHFGSTKTWYGIPAEDAENFEQAMRDAVPELFESQPDLLFQLVTLLTPEQLKKAGVRVYALDQRAGQFVITFPQAYHAGFNHGFNFNEAVNFAPCDWEPFGQDGVERLQAYRKQPCFSHDELLWTAAEGMTGSGLTIATAKWLEPALERIHARETAQRQDFLKSQAESSGHACTLADGKYECAECQLRLTVRDEDVPEDEYSCSICKAYSYLSRFRCDKTGKTLCILHAVNQPCCAVEGQERPKLSDHELIIRKTDDDMAATHKRVLDKARLPEIWEEKYDKLLDDDAVPALKTLRNLLHEGERIPYKLKSLGQLRTFVDRCNQWVDEATSYTARKQQNRRKTEKAWKSEARKSISGPTEDEREKESRDSSNIYRLLDEAEKLGFDSPEIQQLQDRATAIEAFVEMAMRIINHPQSQTTDAVEELLEEGHAFNVNIEALDRLSNVLDRLKWGERAKSSRGVFVTAEEVKEILAEATRLRIEPYNDHVVYYSDQLSLGQQWEQLAQQVVYAETVHVHQLEVLAEQATAKLLPVSKALLVRIEEILFKQREAQELVASLIKRAGNEDHEQRPKYVELLDVAKVLEELPTKPPGTHELERLQRHHENWMRKGKKLFGKTNAPLHILNSHMEYVLQRNRDCLDTESDKPRPPPEPSSREPSPSAGAEAIWGQRDVFCICRRPENGMMIECEICREWYHGKCLKIARGKIKEDEKYTCPVCDWRAKIPRDAARPSLEDLLSWQDEIPGLPFRPEEEQVLEKIIDNAQQFRNHIAPYCQPILSSANEVETQRFYLRKLQGSEVLLSHETNFFQQELHKWSPVAPEPPPIMNESKSTRKPRPTKLQKMLNANGVDDPEKLPEELRAKGLSLKRKQINAEAAVKVSSQAAREKAERAAAHSGFEFAFSPKMERDGSTQPNTPGLAAGSSSGFTQTPQNGPGGDRRFSGAFAGNGMQDAPMGHHVAAMPFGAHSSHSASPQPVLFADKPAGGMDNSNADNVLSSLGKLNALGQHSADQDVDMVDPGLQASVENEEAIDQMFADMTNQDDGDEAMKEAPAVTETVAASQAATPAATPAVAVDPALAGMTVEPAKRAEATAAAPPSQLPAESNTGASAASAAPAAPAQSAA